MTREKAPPRQVVTTSLPLDLIKQLDDYVLAEDVKRNAIIELALRRFFAAEKGRGE